MTNSNYANILIVYDNYQTLRMLQNIIPKFSANSNNFQIIYFLFSLALFGRNVCKKNIVYFTTPTPTPLSFTPSALYSKNSLCRNYKIKP